MSDKDASKRPDATRVLFGLKDPTPPPNYRQDVQHVPGGTALQYQPDMEGRRRLSEIDREVEVAKARMQSVPRVPPRAPSHERIIQRNLNQPRDKMRDKDIGDDFER